MSGGCGASFEPIRSVSRRKEKISIAYGTLSVAIQDSAEWVRVEFWAAGCVQ